MISNDEDLDLFLQELGEILRKYHYDLSPFTLRKINDMNIILGGFSASNDVPGVINPMYYQKIEDE